MPRSSLAKTASFYLRSVLFSCIYIRKRALTKAQESRGGGGRRRRWEEEGVAAARSGRTCGFDPKALWSGGSWCSPSFHLHSFQSESFAPRCSSFSAPFSPSLSACSSICPSVCLCLYRWIKGKLVLALWWYWQRLWRLRLLSLSLLDRVDFSCPFWSL